MRDNSKSTESKFLTLPDDLAPQDLDPLMADQYRRVHLDLFKRWGVALSNQRILKTDLYAEACCMPRAFLLEILKINNQVIGIDISIAVTRLAAKNLLQNGYHNSIENINGDVRHLPFKSDQFDLIISDSTLDHFSHSKDIVNSLKELHRVLAPGGILIITLDNKGNITEPLFRLWIKLGLAPYFIGVTYDVKELKTQLRGVGFQVEEATAIVHNPRFITKVVIKILRCISAGRGDKIIRQMLDRFDRLENQRTKYLTAQFIAIKAKKAVSQ